MANLSKERRDRMIEKLEELKLQHNDDDSIAALNEIENALREKKYGLVWEEHSEEVDDMLKENIPVLVADPERRLCKDENLPWNFIIEGDNLQALYLLEKTHRGKVDCIYIDPPYNKGNRDWKYNNNYVDKNDEYRHSKWLSMMKCRLLVAKRLLNPADSVLIVTIDEREYLHLGCLLEELFPEARIQMVSSMISPQGNQRKNQFSRIDEYLFFVEIGNASVQKLPLSDEWRINAEDKRTTHLHWQQLIRNGKNGTRERSPSCFYPIYVSLDGKKFLGVGQPAPIGSSRSEYIVPENCVAIWPIHKKTNTEGCWALSTDNLIEYQKKGYVKLGKLQKDLSMYITYLQDGMIEKVEKGYFKIDGYAEDGSIISTNEYRSFIPGTQWRIQSHDASRQGNELIDSIFHGKRFEYPKSLYAVHDTIRFFVENKPNAIIVDFFAGSGTTLHAVNLINAEDGGQRRCIMVTNNEVGEAKEKEFIKINKTNPNCVMSWKDEKGKEYFDIIRSSDEYLSYADKWGIATYVTWPRTVCTIKGCDVNNKPFSGDYISTTDDALHMANGFDSNVKMFRCGWTPRKPDDYLLSNALCLHIKELIELQTAQEVDGEKNVLILSKSDYKRIFENPKSAAVVKNVWVNENLVFSSAEMRVLREKKFRYIPREYFSQELKEVGEYV